MDNKRHSFQSEENKNYTCLITWKDWK